MRKVRCLFVTVFLTVLVAGCSGSGPMYREVKPMPQESLCRIAVLPFQNDSDYPLGDVLLQKVFAAQLIQSGDHLVIQEGEIVKAYQQLRLLPGVPPTLEQLQVIADRVGAQLLLTGIILEMREDRGDHQTVNPKIVLEVHLRNATTGEVMWTTLHRRQGTDYKKTMHFGTIHTLTGLSRKMAEEIFNLWNNKGFAQCKG